MYRDYMAVGVRERKAKLSEVLARARAGEEIIVTDRNRPIARLGPYVAQSDVERGIAEGWIEAPRRTRLPDVQSSQAELSTGEVLDEDRGR